MAMYQDYASVEKVEPIRSCRLYFLDIAREYEAIYAHWGQSKYALNALASYDDLDGMTQESFFHRDSSKKAPHNGYTTGEDIVGAIEDKGYEVKYSEDYDGHFKFAEDEEIIELADGEDALKVYPGYQVNKPWFEYNESDGLYYRFEYGAEQTEATTGDQIAVKNVIIQYVPSTVIDSSSSTLNIDTVGTGEGYFITNGKAINVTWSKDADGEPTRYFDADSGDEITLNQGKSFICVVNNPYKDYTSIEGSEESEE